MPVLLLWLFQPCFPYPGKDKLTTSLLQELVISAPPRDVGL